MDSGVPTGAKSEKGGTKIKALIVDENPILAIGVRLLLESTGKFGDIAEARSVKGIRRTIAKCRPAIVITDAVFSGHDTVEAFRLLTEEFPETRFIAFSSLEERYNADRVIRAGFKGYVMKNASPNELVDAVMQVLDDNLYVSPRIDPRTLGRSRSPRGISGSPLGALTERELEIFKKIGTGRNTRQIADDLKLSPKTVDVHRSNIKSKLKIEDLPALIRYAVCWIEFAG